MPKLVDHAERRDHIVSAAGRIIARGGLEAATMAAIAAEAGFSNGALKPYFATKQELLAAAFERVYLDTDRRIAAAGAGRRGIAALRACCGEIVPLDDTTRAEARVVIPFWDQALTQPALADLHESAIGRWRRTIRRHLAEARADGDVTAAVPDARLADLVLTAMHGTQITATIRATDRRFLARQLDDLLALLAR